jgi:hypothetical protein
MNSKCFEHTGVCATVAAVDKKIDKEIVEREVAQNDLWGAVNTIKGWIVLGMGSVALAMATCIVTLLIR